MSSKSVGHGKSNHESGASLVESELSRYLWNIDPIPFFAYPEPIRKVIYTTNAVESLNAQLRQVTRRRGSFPTEDSVRKVLYLAIARAAHRWARPIQDWAAALNYFSIVFEGWVKA